MKRIFLIFTLVFVLIGSGGVWANTFSFLDAAKYGDDFVDATQGAVRGVKVALLLPTKYSDLADTINKLHWNDTAKWADHFDRHGAEVGATSAVDYIYRAKQFISNGIRNKLQIRYNKSIDKYYIYNQSTNEFAVFNSIGGILTYFKPSTAVHPFSTNLDYFIKQGLEILK